MRAEFFESGNLDGHMALVRKTCERSLLDPETVQLAGKIVANVCDYVTDPATGRQERVITAWGHYFWPSGLPTPPAKDDGRELQMIWAFLVKNVRYVYDPEHADTFKTLKQTLLSHSGDCFPEGTLVLRSDGAMVPIEHIVVGDEIHDGRAFVPVLKTWDRGPKTVYRAGLNNASTLRLSDNHKILAVPREQRNGAKDWRAGLSAHSAVEMRMRELTMGADLLQPREFGGGSIELDEDDAVLVAAYLAEGFTDKPGYRISIAGVPNRKGMRERIIAILDRRGVRHDDREREVRFSKSEVPIFCELELGRTALHKSLPHMNWGPRTVATFLEVLDATDGGLSTGGKNVVYSTISYALALQYRVLQRMMGRSTSLKRLDDHGGAGNHPIYRVMARVDDSKRPWARVKSLLVEPTPVQCYDLMTASGRVYLPESDVVVRNCDDQAVAFCALARAIGFTSCWARVISMSGESWEHVYPIVGCPKENPTIHIPFEMTVTGTPPGVEVSGYREHRDFQMSSG